MANVLANGLVDRFAAGGGPQHGVDAAATAEGDAEEAFQTANNLAVREPALLVEFDDSSLRIGSQLGRGGTQGVGRLQGVASLNPPVALPALPDVDVELPVNGLSRDLYLELLGDVRFVQRAAAVGAALGQGCLVDLVDLLGGWRLAVGLGAVVLARFAPGSLGVCLGRALGE